MSTEESKVDIRKVIEAFNQSDSFPVKLDANKANFRNVTLTLDDITWSENTFDAGGVPGYSREVVVNSNNKPTTTSVSASPDAHPGSKLSITTGYVDGFGSPMVSATIQMPPSRPFGSVVMTIDLTKTEQDVEMSKAGGASPNKRLEMRGSGKASITSIKSIYQGSFKAKACLKGPVVIAGQGNDGFQGNIEELARDAKNFIQKPFSYDMNKNALCWTVTGYADLLLEDIKLIKGH